MIDTGLDPSYLWLIVGALFLAVEAFGIPGLGFLFAGLAAIIVGLLVELAVVADDNIIGQAAWFLGFTVAFAVILWKKLKEWRTTSSGEEYSNIIGDTAIVGQGGLHEGRTGQAAWSGTTMMAEIAPDCGTDHIMEGDVVEIINIKGSKLIVAPHRTSR